MKILSISAQKPDSTGSGIYLTELVKAFSKKGHEQAVMAGIGPEGPGGTAVRRLFLSGPL